MKAKTKSSKSVRVKVKEKKRAFTLKALKRTKSEKDESAFDKYKPENMDVFAAIRWDDAWKQFLEVDKNGIFTHRTAFRFAQHLAKGVDPVESKERQRIILSAIGRKDTGIPRGKLVPYLGDWENLRASLFIGETTKNRLLFGNPKVQAIKEIVKKHFDVMEISQGVSTIMLEWIGRYENFATQVDEHYDYKLFDPKLDEEENNERFKSYTRKQEYIFQQTIEGTRQFLKCFGVSESDVALLSQMMIVAMKQKLGDSTANMMLAASTGLKYTTPMGDQPTVLIGETTNTPEDEKEMTEIHRGFHENKTLSTMLGTFLQKATVYGMQHPDVEIAGVKPEDTSTTPAGVKLQQQKANGKANGKARVQ